MKRYYYDCFISAAFVQKFLGIQFEANFIKAWHENIYLGGHGAPEDGNYSISYKLNVGKDSPEKYYLHEENISILENLDEKKKAVIKSFRLWPLWEDI